MVFALFYFSSKVIVNICKELVKKAQRRYGTSNVDSSSQYEKEAASNFLSMIESFVIDADYEEFTSLDIMDDWIGNENEEEDKEEDSQQLS